MITCDLIGRLGNHLFQMATTMAHAWRVGTDFAFPTTALGSYTGEVYYPNLPVIPKRYFPVYREMSHEYKPIPKHLKDIKLHGYWQSEKYFQDFRPDVIKVLGLSPIEQDVDCSIHIRLGDYVTFKDKHPPVSADYLYKSIEVMEDRGCKTFLVFSDDLEQAVKFLPQGIDYTYCHEADPKTSIKKMGGCRNNIIANSSFSWWGAWINDNIEKTVIAPARWFGPGNKHLSPKNIYCDTWIVL